MSLSTHASHSLSWNVSAYDYSRLPSWLLVLGIAGYPLVGLIAALAGLDRDASSIPFRATVLMLALVVILFNFARWHRLLWLLLFWVAYIARLLWDMSEGIDVKDAMMFFAVATVFPAIAVGMVGAHRIQAEWKLLWMGAAISMLSILMYFVGLGDAADKEWAGGRLYFDQANPITLGHAAVMTLLCALCLSVHAKHRLVLLAVTVVAIASILLAGSRGPVVALAGCLIAFTVITRHWTWLVIAIALTSYLILYEESIVIARFLDVIKEHLTGEIEDRSAVERLIVQKLALSQFQESPIVGTHYVEMVSRDYPHNLFIEVLMAMGVGGMVLLSIVLSVTAWRCWALVRADQLLFPILFLQGFIGAQFSGALWGSPGLWILVALILGTRINNTSNQTV